MQHNYSYQTTLSASERIGWKVEDLIGGDKKFDFTKPFMPESLAQTQQLTFLTPQEQLILNQIRGHEYLSMFGLVEEFILPFVLDYERERRALLTVADEQLVFRRAKRTQRREKTCGLEQIGFPLAVRSHEEVLPPGKFERGESHIAKMPQGEFAQAHQKEGVRSEQQVASIV